MPQPQPKSKSKSDLPACPGCFTPLDLYQPDMEKPDRLVGVCHNPDCRAWAMFDLRPGGLWVISQRLTAPPIGLRSPQTAASATIAASAG